MSLDKSLKQQIAKDLKHDGKNEIKVRKANELIQNSRFSLSVLQQRMVLFAISQLDKMKNGETHVEFQIADFCKICAFEYNGKRWAEIIAGMKEIRDQSVWIDLPDGGKTTFAWFQEAYYNEGSGIISIEFNKKAMPYLIELKQKYTEYELLYVLNFRSKYSVRLYELLRSYNYGFNRMETFETEIDLDTLKSRLDALDNSSYSNFTNFRSRVLDKAVKEINENSDMMVEYEDKHRGRGRQVYSIVFRIAQKPAQERMKIRDKVEEDMGWNQLALFG